MVTSSTAGSPTRDLTYRPTAERFSSCPTGLAGTARSTYGRRADSSLRRVWRQRGVWWAPDGRVWRQKGGMPCVAWLPRRDSRRQSVHRSCRCGSARPMTRCLSIGGFDCTTGVGIDGRNRRGGRLRRRRQSVACDQVVDPKNDDRRDDGEHQESAKGGVKPSRIHRADCTRRAYCAGRCKPRARLTSGVKTSSGPGWPGVRAATSVVAPAGFEPAISALRGLRPRPLDDGAAYWWAALGLNQ